MKKRHFPAKHAKSKLIMTQPVSVISEPDAFSERGFHSEIEPRNLFSEWFSQDVSNFDFGMPEELVID
jgi:hypothetical protein